MYSVVSINGSIMGTFSDENVARVFLNTCRSAMGDDRMFAVVTSEDISKHHIGVQ